MKKLLLVFGLCFISMFSNAQTIGDHLNSVREAKPNGELKLEEKSKTYKVISNDLGIMYFFNDVLICYIIAIVPLTQESRQTFISILNDEWVIESNTKWKFYRQDMVILRCELTFIEDVGSTFVIYDISKQ